MSWLFSFVETSQHKQHRNMAMSSLLFTIIICYGCQKVDFTFPIPWWGKVSPTCESAEHVRLVLSSHTLHAALQSTYWCNQSIILFLAVMNDAVLWMYQAWILTLSNIYNLWLYGSWLWSQLMMSVPCREYIHLHWDLHSWTSVNFGITSGYVIKYNHKKMSK